MIKFRAAYFSDSTAEEFKKCFRTSPNSNLIILCDRLTVFSKFICNEIRTQKSRRCLKKLKTIGLLLLFSLFFDSAASFIYSKTGSSHLFLIRSSGTPREKLSQKSKFFSKSRQLISAIFLYNKLPNLLIRLQWQIGF